MQFDFYFCTYNLNYLFVFLLFDFETFAIKFSELLIFMGSPSVMCIFIACDKKQIQHRMMKRYSSHKDNMKSRY